MHVLLLFALIVWASARSSGSPSPPSCPRRHAQPPDVPLPERRAWDNLSRAWTEVEVGRYFWNTVLLAFGSWLTQIVVATTGGFVLSVLRPGTPWSSGGCCS